MARLRDSPSRRHAVHYAPSASPAASSPVQEGKSRVFLDCPSPGKTAHSGQPLVPFCLAHWHLRSSVLMWVSPTPRVGEIITYSRISGSSTINSCPLTFPGPSVSPSPFPKQLLRTFPNSPSSGSHPSLLGVTGTLLY